MKIKFRNCIQASLFFLAFALLTASAWAQETSSNWAPPADWFIYLIIIAVLLGSLVSILLIRAALSTNGWSLSDALSEEIDITEKDDSGKPVMDASNKPLIVRKLCPSSSRMVALMGMIVILFMFLAFGSFPLFYFAKTGEMPSSLDDVVKFLVAGLTLFAPYAVNKFSSFFEGLTPK